MAINIKVKLNKILKLNMVKELCIFIRLRIFIKENDKMMKLMVLALGILREIKLNIILGNELIGCHMAMGYSILVIMKLILENFIKAKPMIKKENTYFLMEISSNILIFFYLLKKKDILENLGNNETYTGKFY